MTQAGANKGNNQAEAAMRTRANQEKLGARVLLSQRTLTAELKPHFNSIVCGSSSSCSVVARRLAENPGVSVLLFRADGTDEIPNVMKAIQWSTNLGTERDGGFVDQPNPRPNGRSIPLNMGKVFRWRLQHQCDGVVQGSQERLGILLS